nr:NADH-quinone oxidoreductase subunit J [Kineosporia sp. A_224]
MTQSMALVGAAGDMGGGETVLFWVLAPVMVLGALGLVFAKKAVHAALCMALVMIGLGIVYFAQQAPFLGSVQIFVYTGAVMMLFLFVLMLVGIDSSDSLVETIKGQRAAATVLGIGAAVLLVSALRQVTFARSVGLTEVNANPGNITSIAGKIFGQYVWAFEVTGALLITAAVGAMMLAHRERLVPRPTQRELSEKRIREGAVKAPLPAPGVFARHNAVDTPALLPDGTPSELSVSRVLATRGQMLSTQHHVDEINAVRDELENPLTHEADVADDGTSVLGPNEGARK